MLVVARYNEDVSWVRDYPEKIIYNKGDINTIPEDLHSSVVQIPNVGREAHTFLYHIVNNYDTLSPIVVFVQGTYKDHVMDGWLDKLFAIPQGVESASYNLVNSLAWGNCASYYGFRIKEWRGEALSPTKYDETYGQWYERVVGEPFPHHHVYVYQGAIFSASKEAICRHPRKIYENLLAEVSDSRSPEAAHFMERTWSKLVFPLSE